MEHVQFLFVCEANVCVSPDPSLESLVISVI